MTNSTIRSKTAKRNRHITEAKIPLGVAVSPDMFLTDCPRLYDEIAAGHVPGYMPADNDHAAAMWVVAVGGVWYSTQDGSMARELFEWQLTRQRQKDQTRPIRPKMKGGY